MPKDTIPFESSGQAVVPRTTTGPTVMKSYRPTYTPSNAERYRKLFDQMIADRTSKKIQAAVCGLKPSTIYLQAQDGLKWLAENDKDRTKYLTLRQEICMSKQDDGVLVYFKPNLANLIVSASIHDPSNVALHPWKEHFSKWLETAQSGDIWNSVEHFPAGLTVTADDRVWLFKLLAGLEGVEADVQDHIVRVMR